MAAVGGFCGQLQGWCCPEFNTIDTFCSDYSYVSLTAGPTWQNDMKIKVDAGPNAPLYNFNTSFKTGYEYGLALGTIMQCWRFEIESFYRKNNAKQEVVDNFQGSGGSSVEHFPARYRSFSIMLNAYYEYFFLEYMNAYVGIGIGPSWVRFQLKDNRANRYVVDAIRFAYQAMAGVEYWLPCNLSLAIQYRFWSAIKRTNRSGNADGMMVRVSEGRNPITHSLDLTLRLTF